MGDLLPAEFLGDRIFLRPVTEGGIRLSLLGDTGGGGMLITRAAADRMGLKPEKMVFDDGEFEVIGTPRFLSDAQIPPSAIAFDGFLVRDPDGAHGEGLLGDGLLGQSWFAERIWRFDYLRQELWLLRDGEQPPADGHRISATFRRTSDGRRAIAFPRVSARVDGAERQFLFDTGATVTLSSDARSALGGTDAYRGTSFIVASVFDTWRTRHPEWRVIPGADAPFNEAMIQVPTVEIAEHQSGPVWFVRRADYNFHEGISQMMDVRIDGALGGSLFRYFCITIDYPRETAHFAR